MQGFRSHPWTLQVVQVRGFLWALGMAGPRAFVEIRRQCHVGHRSASRTQCFILVGPRGRVFLRPRFSCEQRMSWGCFPQAPGGTASRRPLVALPGRGECAQPARSRSWQSQGDFKVILPDTPTSEQTLALRRQGVEDRPGTALGSLGCADTGASKWKTFLFLSLSAFQVKCK